MKVIINLGSYIVDNRVVIHIKSTKAQTPVLMSKLSTEEIATLNKISTDLVQIFTSYYQKYFDENYDIFEKYLNDNQLAIFD